MSQEYVIKVSTASSLKVLFIETVLSMIFITNSSCNDVVNKVFLQYYM